jgi:hypothetical protein
MTKQEILDLYFLDARHKLIEIAAFLDRVERAKGSADFRLEGFRIALGELTGTEVGLANRVLVVFSDPTAEPIPVTTTKSACGAWHGVTDPLP